MAEIKKYTGNIYIKDRESFNEEVNEPSVKNPFIKDLIFKESVKISKIANAPHVKLIDTSVKGNKKSIPVVYAKEELNDKTPFVKIYASNIFTLFLNNSKRVTALLSYIFYKLEYNSDYVVLDFNEFNRTIGEEMNIKADKSGYYAALKELEKREAILKRKPDVYWINPSMFYYGERKYLLVQEYNKERNGRRKES